ncbi:MAG: precorrin-6Y C5,15-methyltransferase (decarboxylating) subunit CbiT, partial [Acutalibacteraceae bacterium]
LAARRGRVYAVERDTAALELISKNREKFCAWNLIPVEGKAPQALEDLPAPDRVFVGGSGGELREILHLVLRKNEHAQICVDAVTLETLTEAWNTMTDLELQPEVTQISASQTKPLGHYHLLAANHPTFLLTGRRP